MSSAHLWAASLLPSYVLLAIPVLGAGLVGRCPMVLVRSPYAGLVIDFCITRSACGAAVYTPGQRHDPITRKESRDDV